MDLVGDERAQSIQIGAVLLFAVLIIAFSSYQAFVVPQQNRQVEFSHSQEVQGQMQDLRNAVVSASDSTGSSALSIKLGTRYPSRAIARNPGPPSGTLRTVGTTDESVGLTIESAQTSGETGDFWNDTQSYNTGAIAYSPQYNVYTNPPATVYDNTVLYNAFRSGNVTVANQSFIDGNDISLVVVNGSLSRSSSGSTSVDVRPASASTQTVQLEDDGSNPVTITFDSTRSADYWDFLVTTQPSVDAVTTLSGPTNGFYEVEVQLATGQTYDLQLTRVGVGTRVTDEDTAYLTDTDGDGRTLSPGETTELTLEVRDRFNNPPDNASETTVTAEVAGSGTLSSTSQTPDEDGEVTFEYTAPSSTGTQDIRFSYVGIDGDYDATTPQNATITVDVQSGGSGSGGSSSAGNSGSSDYSTSDDTETVTSENGRWESIDYTDQIRFSNVETVIIPPADQDRYSNGLTIRNESDIGADYSISFSVTRNPDGSLEGDQRVSITYYGTDSVDTRTAKLSGEASRRVFNDSVYNGTNILDPEMYPELQTNDAFYDYLDNITQMDGSSTTIVFSNNTGRADVTLWDRTLITAVQPDPANPSTLDTNDDGEFVALHFRTPVDTTGWTLENDAGDTTDLPSEELSGTVYFAKNPTEFANNRDGISSSDVYELNTPIGNSAERLLLTDADGDWRDEFAHGSVDTSRGWSLSQLVEGEVANRMYETQFYVDNDTASDWTVESEGGYFATGDAASINLVDGSESTSGGNGEVEFDLENTDGSSSIIITNISVDSTSSDAVNIERGGNNNPEFQNVDSTGELDTTISIDGTTYEMSTNANIDDGSTNTFRFERFTDSGGNNVDMRGEDVTLTLTFSDGSTRQYTLNIPA